MKQIRPHRFFSEINPRARTAWSTWTDLRVRLFFHQRWYGRARDSEVSLKVPFSIFWKGRRNEVCLPLCFVQSAQHPKHLIIQPTFNEHLLYSCKLDFLIWKNFLIFNFNWLMIVLQYQVDFCYTSMWTSHAAAAKSLQSCPTLCNPIDGSPPGSPVPGILQAITLEWVAISFSNEWKWKVKGKSLSCFWLLVTPWTTAYQAPPSMGFSRQEYN